MWIKQNNSDFLPLLKYFCADSHFFFLLCFIFHDRKWPSCSIHISTLTITIIFWMVFNILLANSVLLPESNCVWVFNNVLKAAWHAVTLHYGLARWSSVWVIPEQKRQQLLRLSEKKKKSLFPLGQAKNCDFFFSPSFTDVYPETPARLHTFVC